MKRIFQVGINTFPGSPLNGCVNDIKLLYKIVKEIYGFDQFKILSDMQATRNNIISGLQWLVTDAKAGDFLVFDYSGHGSQVPVTDATANSELDGLDEIICPVDLDWHNPIRDNDLGAMFKILDPEINIVIILDCCHSGTGLRNPLASKIKNRYLPPPPELMLESGEVDLDEELNYKVTNCTRGLGDCTKSFIINTVDQGNALLISGCQDNQTSADAYINGRYQGAMTFALAQALKEANWDITYADLVIKMNEKLDKEDYVQNPQLEGRSQLFNTKFLGGRK